MANIFFQGAVLSMSSGSEGTSIAPLDRIQNVGMGFQIPRTNISVLGKFKPLKDRPVINFTPIQFSFDFIKSSKTIESNLGLLNSTGVGINLANSESVEGFGLRNFEVALAPTVSTSYANKYTFSSGCLLSYGIQGSVGDPVRGSVSFECLDMSHQAENSSKVAQDYSGELIKSENISISGINFSGLGISGLIVQSFSLNFNVNRSATFRLGSKYPERPITDIGANLQINGFLEGINTSFTGLSRYDCGSPLTGSYYLTLLPSCSSEIATTYKLTNPYLESQSTSIAVGNFASVDLSFSCPISIVSSETLDGPNLTIT